jgi:uncharacterized protein (TIGR02996 family)
MDTSERLEAAILSDRDDVELYLVLADELQSRGDPRGELIVMQSQIQAIEDHKERRAMQRRCDQWIAKHDLLGPLRDLGTSVFGRHAEVTWRYGFIRCLEIGWGVDCHDTPAMAQQLLAEILRHPSSTFITWLVLGPGPGDERMNLDCLVDAIVETACPKALRTLHLGKLADWPLERTSTGAIGRASTVLGRLEKLTLEAGTVIPGALALPNLVELKIVCGDLDEQMIEDLARMRCPKLKSLKISYRDTQGDPSAVASTLRTRLKHVRSVSVTRTPASF